MGTINKYHVVCILLLVCLIGTAQDNSHATFRIKKDSGCAIKIAGRIIHSGDTMSKAVFLNALKIELTGCGNNERVVSYNWFWYNKDKQQEDLVQTSKIIPQIKKWVTQQTDTANFVIRNILCFTDDGGRILHPVIVLKLLPSKFVNE